MTELEKIICDRQDPRSGYWVCERAAVLETSVTAIDVIFVKMDHINDKLDHMFERVDMRLSALESFKWQAQGVMAFIILVFAPLCAFVGWYWRNSAGIGQAISQTTGIDLPF